MQTILNPDRALQAYMGMFISRTKPQKRSTVVWKKGEKLKLLLAGYVGTRNTGADVRVEESIRQFRHILGDDQLKLTIMTINPELSKGYFDQVDQVLLPQVFP